MKTLKNILRWWLSLASVFGFLAGWVMLAHAPKPVSASQKAATDVVTTLPALEPLPALGTVTDPGVEPQFFVPRNQQRARMPMFITGGS